MNLSPPEAINILIEHAIRSLDFDYLSPHDLMGLQEAIKSLTSPDMRMVQVFQQVKLFDKVDEDGKISTYFINISVN